jgi:hypothetical protein
MGAPTWHDRKATMHSLRRSLVLTVLLPVLAVVTACASSPNRSMADRDRIGRETIARSTATDVYQLIQSERPAWIRARAGVTARIADDSLEDAPIMAYVDNVRLGTLQDLATVPTHGVTEVRRLSARDATQRFGTGHARGAIVVSTRP